MHEKREAAKWVLLVCGLWILILTKKKLFLWKWKLFKHYFKEHWFPESVTQSSSGLSVLCWPLVRHYCIQSHHTGSACFSVCVYTCMCVSVYSLGPVMVEQASAYWGQVVEPWRLQSSSLDATHVWHLRAWPSQTEQERVPGLRLSMHIQKVAASMQVCNHLLISPFTHTHTHWAEYPASVASYNLRLGNICTHSKVFKYVQQTGLIWNIVTNSPPKMDSLHHKVSN